MLNSTGQHLHHPLRKGGIGLYPAETGREIKESRNLLSKREGGHWDSFPILLEMHQIIFNHNQYAVLFDFLEAGTIKIVKVINKQLCSVCSKPWGFCWQGKLLKYF